MDDPVNSINCYIVGEGGLTFQCVNLLRDAGYNILGIITSQPEIQEWSKDNQIFFSNSFELIKNDTTFDYLFSIVNPHVLPLEILKKAKKLAINFHDSLLPHYAGIHATSWAIANKEKEHGITWHVIEQEIDTGDILKQEVITIAKDETAASLNLKCYEKAVVSFAKLIQQLKDNTFLRESQDLTQRTYYSKYFKPVNYGFINWHDEAETIEHLVRALQFGFHENTLATAKIVLSKEIFILLEVKVTSQVSKMKPGEIALFTKDCLQVATATYDIQLIKMCDFYGRFLSLNYLYDNYANHVTRCSLIKRKFLLSLQSHMPEIVKNESFWVNEIKNTDPFTLPFIINNYKTSKINSLLITSEISETLLNSLNSNKQNSIYFLLAMLMLFFYRLTGKEKITVNYHTDNYNNFNKFFSIKTPLTVIFNNKFTFNKFPNEVVEQINNLTNKLTYLKDIFYRYPQIKDCTDTFPVAMMISAAPVTKIKNRGEAVVFCINKNRLSIYLNKKVANPLLKQILYSIPSQFLIFLTAIKNNKNVPILKIPVLPQAERNKIISHWNNTVKKFPHNQPVHQLFEQQVLKSPQKIAVYYQKSKINYSQLNQRANALAAYLMTLGVKKQTRIILCIERDLSIPICLLGILKTGAIYVPVEPNSPMERFKEIINDAAPAALITHRAIYEKNFKHNWIKPLPIILIDEFKSENFYSNLNINTSINDIAYIIYTSGSTGKPKGVLVPHKGIVNVLWAISEQVKSKKKDVFLALTSLSFDVAALDYYLPLCLGGALIIAASKMQRDAIKILKLLNQKKITYLQATPWTGEMLKAYKWNPSPKFKLLFAGEALSSSLAEYFSRKCILFNVYGPTETSIYATIKAIKSHTKVITIGKPLANVTTYILNDYLQPLPIGYPGELYIGGAGVACGYLNREELTKEKFISNPFSTNSADKLYKTGDLVRWLPNGELEYLSRIDNQVKIRGFRIELSEVEHAILRHPSITQAVVLPQQTLAGHQQLIAFIILNKTKNLSFTMQSLRLFLKDIVPDYMLPASCVLLEQFPLTTNGKIDKQTLLTKINKLLPVSLNYHPPLSELEYQLVSVWQQILNVYPIGIEDDFFALGGDSILAMQLIAAAEKEYNFTFNVEDVFNYTTISKLATRLKFKRKQMIIKSALAKEIPLTPIQHWFFEKNFANPEQWSQVCIIESKQPLNEHYLKESLLYLINHSDALKYVFLEDEDQWKQCRNFQSQIIFERHDISLAELTNNQVNKWVQKIHDQFNLTYGPLIGLILLQDAYHKLPDKILFIIHHLLIDGVSWRLLLANLQKVYEKMDSKQTLPILSNSVSYGEWSCNLKQLANSPPLIAQKDYWLNIMKNFRAIPIDNSLGNNIEEHSKSVKTKLSAELTQSLLGEVHSLYQTYINEILLTALLKTFCEWVMDEKLFLDLESHGRQDNLTQLNSVNTLGWFTSIFPVVLRKTTSNLLSLLLSVKEQLRKIPHQGFGYSLLRYLTNDEQWHTQIKSYNSPAIAFNYWGQFEQNLNQSTLFKWEDIKLVSGSKNSRTHLINIDCVIQNNCFTVNWAFSQDCYQVTTIRKLANSYQKNLTQLINLCINKKVEIDTNDKINLSSNIVTTSNLTPLQQGLLWHYIRDTSSLDYEVQLSCVINKPISISDFQTAWQEVINRHTILRSAFKWQQLDEPQQITYQEVEFSLNFYSWEHLEPKEQELQWQEFLLADRYEKIDLDVSPLFRLNLIKFEHDHYKMIFHTHHLLLDGWSIANILSEFVSFYEKRQESFLLPAVPSFVEYVDWLNAQDFSEKKHFWRNYLREFSEPTSLSKILNHSNKKINNHTAYIFEHLELTEEQTRVVKNFVKLHYITLNTLFQVIWGILLSRYSQSEDVVFGVTVSGRNISLADIDKRTGLFINTIPLRIKFTPSLTINECLEVVQKSFITLLPHSHLPLTDIHACTELAKSNLALFESIVVFENYPLANNMFNQIEFWDPTHYLLTFIISPKENISLKIGFHSSDIEAKEVANLLKHVRALLEQIITKPTSTINYLPMAQYNYGQQCILNNDLKLPIKLFEEQAARIPHQLAVFFEGKICQYGKLNKQANQLAHFLKSKGVELEVVVACCLMPGIELITCLLAIWKAGGVYLPLDPTHPRERLETILSHSKAAYIITNDEAIEKIINNHLLFNQSNCFNLDELKSLINNHSEENLNCQSKLGNLSYILFTSGTTEIPKGVAQEHKTLANLISWQTKVAKAKKHKISQLASMNFDVSLQEITYALCNGYELYTINSLVKKSLTKLIAFLNDNQLTQLFLPTALLEPFCEAARVKATKLPHLCEIFVAGEALKITPSINKFFKNHQHISLTNQYGPTETHVISFYQLPHNFVDWPIYPPIGKPIDNTYLYIIDNLSQLAPIGIPGELYAVGAGVAKGYLNNHQQTKEKFLASLPSLDGLGKYYATGDKVRWNAVGELEYLGRLDEQIKIRGHRIEPGEIEAVLLKQPQIRQCFVTAKCDLANSLQLVCYFVPYKTLGKKLESLQQALSQILPVYMLPKYYIELEDFPLTNNGKINKKLLPEPQWLTISTSYLAPRNIYDKEIMQLWCAILKIGKCSINDNFFALGGHSLNVLHLLLAIEKKYKIHLTVNDIHANPDILQLSDKIQQNQANYLMTAYKKIKYEKNNLPFPILPLQSEGKKTPLFLIHPVGGTLFWFIELVRYLGGERPIYGIQDPSILAEKILFKSIEEMSAYYLHCIRSIQPQGPYLIAGTSFGATIAFDIARQLNENNEFDNFIGLLDGWAFYPKALKNKERFNKLMYKQTQDLYKRFQINQLKNPESWINLQWFRNNMLWQYSLPKLSNKLILFKAKKVYHEFSWANHPTNYWQDYSEYPIEVHKIPGDHESMFKEPNVKFLADSMKSCFNIYDKSE